MRIYLGFTILLTLLAIVAGNGWLRVHGMTALFDGFASSVEIVDNANDLQTIVADGNADKHHSSRAQSDCSAARASSYRWATGRLYNRRDSVLRVISPGVHWTIDTSILT